MPTVPFAFETSEVTPIYSSSLASCVLAKAPRTPLQVTLLAHQGLPDCTIFFIGRCLQLDATQMASLLGMTPRAFRAYRQRRKVLDASKSERVRKLAQVLALGKEVFGEIHSFNNWLQKPAYGLAGELPIDLLYSNDSIDLVADELTRIASGDLT